MLLFALQVLLFAGVVDESMGCFNCPSGRSLLGEREVIFVS